MRLSLALLVAAVLLCLTHIWAYPAEGISTQRPTDGRNDVEFGTDNSENSAPWKEVKDFTREDVQNLKDFVFQYYTGKGRFTKAEFDEFSHKVGGPEKAVKILYIYYKKRYRRPGFFFNSLKAKWGKQVYDHYGQRDFTKKSNKFHPADYISYIGKQMYDRYRYTLPFESVDNGIDSSGTRSTTPTSTAPNGERPPGTSSARNDSVVAARSKDPYNGPRSKDDEYMPQENGDRNSNVQPDHFTLNGRSGYYSPDNPWGPRSADGNNFPPYTTSISDMGSLNGNTNKFDLGKHTVYDGLQGDRKARHGSSDPENHLPFVEEPGDDNAKRPLDT
ncbi:hypothetical protein IWQ61_000674 [Dispira simplex]|nr:hypothetical protein IWQ61_000674 [Dispira simplex]